MDSQSHPAASQLHKRVQVQIFEEGDLSNTRELDSGTIYFRNQIANVKEMPEVIYEAAKMIIEQILWCSIIYRLVNREETFHRCPSKTIPSRENIPEFLEWSRRESTAGRPFFTSAHQTNGFRRFEKTVQQLIDKWPTYSSAVLKATTMKEACKKLQDLYGIGKFLAWQICCDLAESGVHYGADRVVPTLLNK